MLQISLPSLNKLTYLVVCFKSCLGRLIACLSLPRLMKLPSNYSTIFKQMQCQPIKSRPLLTVKEKVLKKSIYLPQKLEVSIFQEHRDICQVRIGIHGFGVANPLWEEEIFPAVGHINKLIYRIDGKFTDTISRFGGNPALNF